MATGVRPLGGVALVVLAALAGRWAAAPRSRQVEWYVVVAVCFVVSHVLGHAIGAWAAVAVVTAVATGWYVKRVRAPSASDGLRVPTVRA